MPQSAKFSEESLQLALAKAREQKEAGKKVNFSALEREFQVGRQVIKGRLEGNRTSYANRSPYVQHTKLDQSQEKVLLEWIHLLDSWGSPPTPNEIENCANSILRRSEAAQDETDTSKPTRVGTRWKYNFIKRHSLPLIYQKPIKDDSLQSEDLGQIQHWFVLLDIQIKRHKINVRNMYNFDERGFRLGEGKRQKVVSFNPAAKRGSSSTETGETVTDIECIAADGFVLPPYFILKGEHHLERWYESSQIPDDYRINVSPTGWSNDLIAFDWIQHFHAHTKDRVAPGEKRLLLMDNHGSHLTRDFIEFCAGVDIILFPFPPHTTHFLQPLDGKPFLALKHYFRQSNTQISRWGFSAADKASFLEEMPKIRENAFKSRTIRNSFKERGLWPLDPEKILSTLRQQVEEPELQIFNGSPPPQSSPTVTPSISPPNTIRTARRRQKKILETPDALLSSRKYQRRIRQAAQGHIDTIELLEELKGTVSYLQRKHENEKKQKSRRHVKKPLSHTGALEVADAKRYIEERGAEERAAMVRRAQREWRRSKRVESSSTQDMSTE